MHYLALLLFGLFVCCGECVCFILEFIDNQNVRVYVIAFNLSLYFPFHAGTDAGKVGSEVLFCHACDV